MNIEKTWCIQEGFFLVVLFSFLFALRSHIKKIKNTKNKTNKHKTNKNQQT